MRTQGAEGSSKVHLRRDAMVDDNPTHGVGRGTCPGGVALLAALVAYFAQGRGNPRLLFWLIAIWLLACVVAFALNPMTTWPLETT